MYCNAALPAEAAQATRQLPEDLDELVARALGPGGRLAMARLEDRLRAPPGGEGARAATDPPPAAPTPGARPAATPPAPRPAPRPASSPPDSSPPAPSPPAPSAPSLDSLHARLDAARGAMDRGDPAAARDALLALSRQATVLAETLPPVLRSPAPPAPAAVALPPLRKPFMLVVEGLADAGRAADLAAHLGVDLATARQIALARCARVALRGSDRAPLDARATAIGAAGVACCVVPRAALESLGPATLVLGLADPAAGPGPSAWVVTDTPHGLAAAPPDAATLHADARELEATELRLAVPGEVLLRRRAEARDLGYRTHKRYQGARDLGESRVPVLDLHGPGVHLRLVAGVTSPAGWPVTRQASSLRSFRELIEALPTAFPGIFVEGARACSPPRGVPMRDGAAGRARETHTLDGWPTWEEHTRICRILHRVDG